ncbi:hypothetical protein ACHAXA_010883 [Cyclostephanos tholiformis]|uniref:TAF6 C-terminal HEAT repeat domain-containing protein n=1 Tax=Cyclostephanos tholiformis TaxID=382380 RepID=A0ABD3SD56_9STRA
MALVKACDVYGHQYATVRPRVIKLLTQQALRPDRPLSTQYGGIVGISLFGPRAIDAFLLPIAGEYWERWEEELRGFNDGVNGDEDDAVGGGGGNSGGRRRDVGREYELTMCQQALLDALRIFMGGVTPAEQARRVDVMAFSDVFGERLIPMRPDLTEYMTAVV